VRLLLTLRKTEFTEQSAMLQALLSGGNVRRLCLDATGMGAPLAEDLARRYPLRVEPVTFTAALKEKLAVGVKVALQRREMALPPDRELIAQLRGLRRLFGEGGRLRFDAPGAGDTDAGPNTHSDRFWALALAWHASEADQRATVAVRRMR
jgi:phage FluMu gp28-like protein